MNAHLDLPWNILMIRRIFNPECRSSALNPVLSMKRSLKVFVLLTYALALGASVLHATPYASGISNNAGTVSFVLNEAADNVTVTLTTQFGTEVVEIGPPQWLCNPTKKIHNGVLTPITNPTDHLVCYEIHPSQPIGTAIVRQDQFGPGDGFLTFNRWLCVPSLKEHPTGTEGVTWSRVRALYR